MKQLYLLLLLLLSCFSFAQEKWITESGTIKFEASVPLFEEISAQNNLVKCVINSEEKTIVCLLKIKDFEFKICMPIFFYAKQNKMIISLKNQNIFSNKVLFAMDYLIHYFSLWQMKPIIFKKRFLI